MRRYWPTVRLGEVLQPRKEFIIIDDLQTYKRPRVQLHAQGIVIRDEVPGAMIKTKKQQLCHAGDFLVAEIDAKVGGFGLVPLELENAIVSSHYFLFVADQERLNRTFLGWFIKTPAFREQVEAQGSTNYAAIRSSDVMNYEIPLPPLPEQQRIVTRIEELAAKITEARSLRQQAVEEAEALEEHGIEETFQVLRDDKVPHRQFVEVCSRITVGHVSSMKHAYRESGIPFLRSQNVRKNRFEPNGLSFIAHEFHDANRKSALSPGDVVIVRTGFVGIACVIPTNLQEANCADLVIVCPKSELDPYYAAHFLNSLSGRERAVAASVGSAQKHYNVGAMKPSL